MNKRQRKKLGTTWKIVRQSMLHLRLEKGTLRDTHLRDVFQRLNRMIDEINWASRGCDKPMTQPENPFIQDIHTPCAHQKQQGTQTVQVFG